jgi:hypothetical protein
MADETKPTTVTLTMSLREARQRASGLADLLCWASGFRAGAGPDAADLPEGIEDTRALKHRLDMLIANADPEEMPF